MGTSNPALKEDTFLGFPSAPAGKAMTIEGTVHRAILLVLLVAIAAAWSWLILYKGSALALPLLIGGALGALVVALVTIFKKEWSPYTTPLYAVLEGFSLGVISGLYEADFPGIVLHAVMLTFGTLFALLAAYRSGLIPPTENVRLGIVAATGAVVLVYVVDLLLRLFGHSVPFIHDSGPVGIFVSLIIVGIAALNLVLDFDFIEQGAEHRAPKYMEWYAAFGLLVTLVWLYVEILRLLAKMRRQD